MRPRRPALPRWRPAAPRGSTGSWASRWSPISPVEAPIDQTVVLCRVAKSDTDPRSTFPSFDTTVSTDANNFHILDFLLFLEYIESKFYDINVPRFT